MYPFLDEREGPLSVGDKVEVKYCCGAYGQTRTVRGIIKEFDQHGGIYVTLDETTAPFAEYSRFGASYFNPGDVHYICNAFSFSSKLQALVGKGEHHDYEHGHDFYCRKRP